MKKIFVLLCLAYAANGCAASGRIVATIGALVPLIPGVMYFHDETQRERARVESEMISVEYEDLASNEEFEKRKNEIDSLRPFVVGTFLGVMHPPYNIVIAGLAVQTRTLMDCLNHIEPSTLSEMYNHKNAVPVTMGVVTGVSSHTIYCALLKILRKGK